MKIIKFRIIIIIENLILHTFFIEAQKFQSTEFQNNLGFWTLIKDQFWSVSI